MERPLTATDAAVPTMANRSVPPMFGKNGKALTPEERADIARRRGICKNCGIQTHKITLAVSRKITNAEVYKGDCIRCNQELVPPVIYSEWKQKHGRVPPPPPSSKHHKRGNSLDCDALCGAAPTHRSTNSDSIPATPIPAKPAHRRIHSTNSYDALAAMSQRSSGSYEPIIELPAFSVAATQHKRIDSNEGFRASITSVECVQPAVEIPTVLTVFEASPLAYEDDKGREIALPALELEKESSILKEALEETGIRLEFRTATTNNLGAFLSRGQHQLLHLSCHGNQKYLFIENDYGGAQQLLVDDHLRPWIRTASSGGTASSSKLRFVFVSACHSRSAGDAFCDAGIAHVVCCEQDAQVLNNTAAMIFTRDLYRSLAFGRTLQQAFDLAIHAVILSPELKRTGLDSKKEAQKFCLLPEHGNHDVAFFPRQGLAPTDALDGLSERSGSTAATSVHPLLRASSNPAPTTMLLPPVPPRFFIGRELDIYRVLKALFVRECRLVRIMGAPGIGKATLAKAAGHYIAKRKMWGDTLAWLPSARKLSVPQGNEPKSIAALLLDLFAALKSNDDESFDARAQDVLDDLYEKKATIIINTKDVAEESIPKLSEFLDDVFERTKHVKVILIGGGASAENIKSKNVSGFSCPEVEIALEPLDYAENVALFGKICQHSTPSTWSQEILLHKKSDATFQAIGEGNPSTIRVNAKTMTREEYENLVKPVNAFSSEDSQSSGCVLHDISNSFGEENTDRGVSLKEDTSAQQLPPKELLHSQSEIQERFLPLLKQSKVYRKNVTSFIRKAKKGEQIVTELNGVTESRATAKDDNSWVVCARSAGEYYIVTDAQFRENYDQSTAREIDASYPSAAKLRCEGFLEYSSRRKIWAFEMDESGMRYLQRKGEEAALEEAAYFMAPWDEPVRVEVGDYLATTYGEEEKVEIYRIERGAFGSTYIDCSTEAAQVGTTGQLQNPQSGGYALAIWVVFFAVLIYFHLLSMNQG